MKFLVCDDNKASVDSISKLLYSLCQKHNISVSIDSYTDAKELLRKELKEYNVALLWSPKSRQINIGHLDI